MPKGPKVKYTDAVLDKLADSLRAWADDQYKNNAELGLLSDWCMANKLDIRFPPKYARKHTKFGEAYWYAKGYQELTTVKGALTKKLDGRFAQFFLGCNHGWVTQSSQDNKNSALERLATSFDGFQQYMKDEYKNKGVDLIEVNEDGELEQQYNDDEFGMTD